MRALFCLNGPNYINGPNVWLLRHLPRLRAYGIEPRVLYLHDGPDRPCRFRSALEADGIGTRVVRNGTFTEDDVTSILEGIAAEQPDVFVPNYSVPAHYACRFAREAGIRTIGVLHSDDPYYDDVRELFVTGEEPWRLDGLVAVSRYLHDLARASATPSTRVLLATYGVPVGKTQAEPPSDTLELLYVGRFVERQKRISRLAHRLSVATATIDGVRATMYGDGPDHQKIADLLVSLGSEQRVRIGGPVPPEAMARALGNGHVLVLLSDFEGLSIALMEAMACGVVPIVAATRSGTDDLVEHEVNALIVDPECEADFVTAVRRLRHEAGLWTRLSAAARRTIVERGYTSDDCARRWAAFCRELAPTEPRRALTIPARRRVLLPPETGRLEGLRIGEHRDPRLRPASAVNSGRPLYVWGAGSAGRQFMRSAAVHDIMVDGVIDRAKADGRSDLEGVIIHPPVRLSEELSARRRPFVIIASIYGQEIGRELEQLGFEPERDFIMAGQC